MSILERFSLYRGFPGNETKPMSKADFESRNIPVNTNLISALISMLSGLSIKVGKIKLEKKTKFLSDVSISTVESVP